MSRIPDDEKKKVFFYADEDAKYYDLAEELTQRCMGLIHDTMVDLVEYSLTWKGEQDLQRPFYVLNVASGTGAEALRLLERFDDIQIFAIDFNAPMNREFRRKFDEKYPDRNFASCVTLIEDDFFGEACSPDELISLLPGNLDPQAFDAVIAGFFLHHYPVEVKREFYLRAHAVLRSGGALVLGENISFESQRLSQFAHDFGYRWIEKQFSKPDQHLRSKYDALGSDAERLGQKWIDHWQNDHIYAPDVTVMDGQTRPSHTSMALEAGFRKIGFPFRLWMVAILWGEK